MSADRSPSEPSGPSEPDDASVRDLLTDPRVLIDSVLPPLLFVGVEAVAGLQWAAAVSLGLAVVLVGWRLLRGHRLVYAVTGLGGAAAGVGLALWTGDTGAYFVPGIIGNVVVGIACVISVLIKRPLIAASGMAIYRWPWAWYVDDRVRPAYSEITWLWAVFYLAKAGLQGWLVGQDAVGALAVVRVATGYPAFAVMLLLTYLYVEWRLKRLDAPDVETYRTERASEAPEA